jgi:hypothetical protein
LADFAAFLVVCFFVAIQLLALFGDDDLQWVIINLNFSALINL